MRAVCFAVLACLMAAGCTQPAQPAATTASVLPVYNQILRGDSDLYLGDPPFISSIPPTKDAPTRTPVYSQLLFRIAEPNKAVWRLKFNETTRLEGLSLSMVMDITHPSVQQMRGTINIGDCTWRLFAEIMHKPPNYRAPGDCVDVADPVLLPQTRRVEWNVSFDEDFKVKTGETLQLVLWTNVASREPAPSVHALSNHTKEPALLKLVRPSGFGPSS